MQIGEGAGPIYNDYMGRTKRKISVIVDQAGNTAEREVENISATAYVKEIFALAAGPDGVLSEEEARAVDTFLKDAETKGIIKLQKGADAASALDNISLDDAKALLVAWKNEVKKLPLTSYDDISKSFVRINEQLGVLTNSLVDIENFICTVEVFCSRIYAGRNTWSGNSGTVDMICKQIFSTMTAIMEKKFLMPDQKMKLAYYFISLYEATDPQNVAERHRTFYDEFFSGSRIFPKEHGEH